MFNKYIPFGDLMLKTQHPFSHPTKLHSSRDHHYLPPKSWTGAFSTLVRLSAGSTAQDHMGSEGTGEIKVRTSRCICPSPINKQETSCCPPGLSNEPQEGLEEYVLSVASPAPSPRDHPFSATTSSKRLKIRAEVGFMLSNGLQN